MTVHNLWSWVPSSSHSQPNDSVADPLTAKRGANASVKPFTLRGRPSSTVRHEIRVEASTSVESSRVVDNFIAILGSTEDSGTLKYQLKDHAVSMSPVIW